MITPIVNSNGSTKNALMADRKACMTALRAAQDALNTLLPHGRDYQTAEPGRYAKAREQHAVLMDKLAAVFDEVHAHTVNLMHDR